MSVYMNRMSGISAVASLFFGFAVVSLAGCDAERAQAPPAHTVAQEAVAEQAVVDDRERFAEIGETASESRDGASDSGGSDAVSSPARQLIYTGTVVLAAFDVEARQRQAIVVVEEKGGYVTHRSAQHLVLRVPVAEFRSLLDEIAELGDVLEMNWEAEDVTEEMRDLEIRLDNAIELQSRLQDLLDRADTVEDALEIEAELERVTLDIERIRGQLESMEERIAYSTLEVHFDPKEVEEVPDDEFLVPVAWLDDLGLESLLGAPERLR